MQFQINDESYDEFKKNRIVMVHRKKTKKINEIVKKTDVTKTLKNRKHLSHTEKSDLWKIFDMDSKEDNLQKEEINEKDIHHDCLVCHSPLTIMEDGFPTCTNAQCGIMYKNVLDFSPEWRFFGGNDKHAVDQTRCGNPINPLLKESSFGCKILCDHRSSYEMKRIRKWTEWQATPHKEKSLYDEFQFITIMAQNSGIPKIFIDCAMIVHKDISEQKMFRGINRDGIKAASIYISCRLNGCQRTAYEIAIIFKLDRRSATSGCSMAVTILNNIERSLEPSQRTEFGKTTAAAFIDRYCSKLNINNELALLAKFIAGIVENDSIMSNNTPQSSATGILYFISETCGLGITKKDIKQVCGVSEVTVNKCYRKLFSIKEKILPKCIIQKYTS
jgi:transcription initiation factor TFIIB